MRNPLYLLHPRQFRGLWLLLIVTVAALAAAVAGTALVAAEQRGLAIGLLLAVGLVAGWFLLTGYRPVWTTVAGVFGFLLVVSTLVEIGPTILQLRGERVVQAQVVAVREAGSLEERFHYTLATTTAFRPVGGELTESGPARAVGDPVTVVEDPNELAHPMLPSSLAEHRQSWLALIVLYLITAGLCLVAGRPRRRPA